MLPSSGDTACSISRQTPEARRREIPKCHFVKTSKQPLRELRKRARDGHGTEMREPRASKGAQDESRKPFFATFCRPPRNAVRRDPAPRVSPAREMAGKRTNGVCMRADSIRSGKSPPKPCFFPSSCTRRDCLAAKKFRLCGKRFISLRKAILFLPRKSDRRDGEMLHTNSSSTRFLTVRLLFYGGLSCH